MRDLKKKRVIALRKVGVDRKSVEEYRKSSREYLVQYRGKHSQVITQELLDKVSALVEIRREMDVEIAGAIFEDNLTVTFIFYVNGNPEDAWFEKNQFQSVEDFEMELDRQIAYNFIPDKTEQKHVFYEYGHVWDIVLF